MFIRRIKFIRVHVNDGLWSEDLELFFFSCCCCCVFFQNTTLTTLHKSFLKSIQISVSAREMKAVVRLKCGWVFFFLSIKVTAALVDQSEEGNNVTTNARRWSELSLL